MPRLWAGIDAGKSHHHCVVIDDDGRWVISRKVANDESDLQGLIEHVLMAAEHGEVLWAIDLNRGGASLLIGLLTANAQPVLYVPGRTVHYASQTYRGAGKTDAKDAAIIADQARMRRDLHAVRTGNDITIDLGLLIAHRSDLVEERTRAFNRLRANLLDYFPALEAAFDYNQRKGAVVLLRRYQTPEGIRRAGVDEISAWLREQDVFGYSAIAEAATEAAERQHILVHGETMAALIVSNIASDILRLIEEVAVVERLIEARLRQHEYAEILLSVPGFGPLLAAEFLAATGGRLEYFENSDRLASFAGVAPVPRNSGIITGTYRRPTRYDRRLLRACYLSAQAAARTCPVSKAYYERKRAEGKNHKQAVLALARRRINVIWALLREGRPFEPRLPAVAPGMLTFSDPS